MTLEAWPSCGWPGAPGRCSAVLPVPVAPALGSCSSCLAVDHAAPDCLPLAAGTAASLAGSSARVAGVQQHCKASMRNASSIAAECSGSGKDCRCIICSNRHGLVLLTFIGCLSPATHACSHCCSQGLALVRLVHQPHSSGHLTGAAAEVAGLLTHRGVAGASSSAAAAAVATAEHEKQSSAATAAAKVMWCQRSLVHGSQGFRL